MTLRVLTLSTLFPDSSRPRFGPFVERQTIELAAHPNVELQVAAPIGLPPFPLSRFGRYAPLRALPKQEQWKGLTVHRPRFRHWPGGRSDAQALAKALLPRLRKLRADFPFDVIDAEFFFPDGPAAVQIGEALGAPVSIKARGSDIHFWGAQREIREQIIEAGRKADGLLTVSEALKADMIGLGMPEDRIGVHYTGVDLNAFRPPAGNDAKHALNVSGSLIVCVGNLIEAKGQAVLIEALPHLPGFTLALIGQGPDRADLEVRARRRQVADRVIFTGPLDQAEVASWLAAADVMALASASEGLANVWIEALACGTPVVTTDVGGVREVITGPDAGLIVAADPLAFADAIRTLVYRPRARADVRKFAEKFTWTANTDALYAHLCKISGYSPRSG